MGAKYFAIDESFGLRQSKMHKWYQATNFICCTFVSINCPGVAKKCRKKIKVEKNLKNVNISIIVVANKEFLSSLPSLLILLQFIWNFKRRIPYGNTSYNNRFVNWPLSSQNFFKPGCGKYGCSSTETKIRLLLRPTICCHSDTFSLLNSLT